MTPYIANPFNTGLINTIGLTQIAGYKVPASFVDSNNVKWELVKDAFNSALSVPDPQQIYITDYWCHSFPSNELKERVYVYVVEGIKRPQTDTELPVGILYSWFSKKEVLNFTPAMITNPEWMRANVYSSNITNARVSKLKALCGIKEFTQEQNSDLIQMNMEKDGGKI